MKNIFCIKTFCENLKISTPQIKNFILVFFVFLFIACDKKNGLLNNANQNFDKLQVKTLVLGTKNSKLSVRLVDDPTFYTDVSPLVFLGNYQDPVLGRIKNRFYTSLQLKSLLPLDVGRFTIDSVNIYLIYGSDFAYGIEQNSAKLKPEMYLLTEQLKSKEEFRYNFTSTIAKESNSWSADLKVLPLKPTEKFNFTHNGLTVELPPVLVFSVKKELGEKIFQKSQALQEAGSVLTQDLLLEEFPGFVFETRSDNSGVAAFDLQNNNTVVRIFYKNQTNELGYYDLGLYFNNSNYFTQVDRKKSEDLKNIYAFQGAGLGLEVDLSIIKKTVELEKKSINQAVLYFYLKDEIDKIKDTLPVIPVNLFWPFGKNPSSDSPYFLQLPFPSFLNFLPIYNSQENRYELYLTAYLQNLLSGAAIEEKINIFSKTLVFNRTIIDIDRTELHILYTDFQK